MLNRVKEEIGLKHFSKSYQIAAEEISKIENPYTYSSSQSTYDFSTNKFENYEFGFYQYEQYPNSIVIEENGIEVSALPISIPAA